MNRNGLNLMKALRRTDAGTAIVEMVVISPLLLFILIGLIEVGRYGDYAIRVGNAARAGVQFGAQNIANAGDNAQMQQVAINDSQLGTYNSSTNQTGLSAAATSFCECAPPPSTAAGTQVSCTTVCPTHLVIYVQVATTGTLPAMLLNSQFLPPSLRVVTISRTAVMRVAQ